MKRGLVIDILFLSLLRKYSFFIRDLIKFRIVHQLYNPFRICDFLCSAYSIKILPWNLHASFDKCIVIAQLLLNGMHYFRGNKLFFLHISFLRIKRWRFRLNVFWRSFMTHAPRANFRPWVNNCTFSDCLLWTSYQYICWSNSII